MQLNELIRRDLNLLNESSNEQWKLHPDLNPINYKITTFDDIDNWTAKILTGNSLSQGLKIGGWVSVGYIMINITNNTIIPISRSDEHNSGYDLLYKILKTDKPSNFVPIFKGSNYIYYSKDIPIYKIAIEKWLNYGGPNYFIEYLDYDNNRKNNFLVSFKGFLEDKGSKPTQDNQLNELGEELIKHFSMLSEAIKPLLNDTSILGYDTKVKHAFNIARKLIKFLNKKSGIFSFHWKLLDNIKNEIDVKETEQDIKWLEQKFFGMSSIKNVIHNELRENSEPGSFDYDKFKMVYGDIELAIKLLASL